MAIISSSKPPARGAIAKWLAVVGIGEDGIAGLGSEARRAIGSAEFVFGGCRHLELAAALIRGEARPWPTPFDSAVTEILALSEHAVCVLASGDPFHFGVGAVLARYIDAAEMSVFPGPSAFSLAASRLGWALQDCDILSLHGRPIDLILPFLHPRRRVIALTSDGKAPALLAQLLIAEGFGASRFHILEALGGPNEAILTLDAKAVGTADFAPLNVVAIDVDAIASARVLPLGNGLADTFFEHDGQITKREVRAVTMSVLSPRRGELLWDVGAGSGSVAIEWMLLNPSLRAIAIERNKARAERIRRNATSCGVPDLKVIEGEAPEALVGLPQPDAIFIGGGGNCEMIEAAVSYLRQGGRLVVNCVTLETEAIILSRYAELGGELMRIGIEHAAAIGSMTGWRAAMPITQWSWSKP